MLCMTLDCIRPMQTIYCNVGLKCFFNFTKMFVIIVVYAHFIDISQDKNFKRFFALPNVKGGGAR